MYSISITDKIVHSGPQKKKRKENKAQIKTFPCFSIQLTYVTFMIPSIYIRHCSSISIYNTAPQWIVAVFMPMRTKQH